MTRRRLTSRERERLFRLHGGLCHICGYAIDPVRDAWEISHEIPLALGGRDDDLNRKPAHKPCHARLTAGKHIPQIAKAERVRARYLGTRPPSDTPLPGGRFDRLKKPLRGPVVWRDSGRPVGRGKRI